MFSKSLATNSNVSAEELQQRTHITAFGSAYSEHQESARAKIDVRVVPVWFHCMRILGLKRNQPLYGKEGDLIAERFRGLGWDWIDCTTPEPIPFWIRDSRTNEVLAWMIVGTVGLVVALSAISVTRSILHSTAQSQTPAPMVGSVTSYGYAQNQYGTAQPYGSHSYRVTQSNSSLSGGRLHVVVNR